MENNATQIREKRVIYAKIVNFCAVCSYERIKSHWIL